MIAKETISVIGYTIFNIVCSIAIVLLNKWVYVHIGFPNLTLTLFHFVTTFLGLVVCETYNVFNIKTVNPWEIMPLALTFLGFVIFTNLSLQYNTIGSYQMAKVLTTPIIAIIQEYYFCKRISIKIKVTLLIITVGVAIVVFNDIQYSVLGSLFAAIGVVITSCYQVLVASKQAELQMNHMQLLYHQSFMASAMLMIILVSLEPPWATFNRTWSLNDGMMIFATCVIAFFLNLSIYWIIGNTSPLTYNMVGHIKFCLTVMGGFLIFEEPLTPLQIFGVFLTLTGITIYGQIKYYEEKQDKKLIQV